MGFTRLVGKTEAGETEERRVAEKSLVNWKLLKDREKIGELIAVDGTLLPALPRMAWAVWLAESQAGVTIQVYCALIASVLLVLWTGSRPTKRQWETLPLCSPSRPSSPSFAPPSIFPAEHYWAHGSKVAG